MPREGIGAEHPLNDRAQVVFILVFLVVWIVDSFILHYGISFVGLTALLVSIPIGVVLFLAGRYLVRQSTAAVFSNNEAKVIDTGVYGKVRHPMYFGGLLLLLGFTVATLSILSFIVWVAFFIFWDQMATYEEKDLTRLFGQQYIDYQKRVHKWLPI